MFGIFLITGLGWAGGLYSEPATLLEEPLGGGFGAALAGPGDINGDGFDDVVVGDYGAWRAYVYQGSAEGVSPSASVVLEGREEHYGIAVGAAGDLNADGYPDVVVGGEGEVYAFAGGPRGLSSAAMTSWSGWYVYSVAGAGDVNADGVGDLLVGNKGMASLYFGSGTGPSVDANSVVTNDGVDDYHDASDDYFGVSVAGAGDVDGDGFDDVLVGAAYGFARLYPGSPGGLVDAPTTLSAGWAVTGAGDVDADGYDDVVVSGWSARPRVYPGAAGGIDPATSGELFELGYSVASAGDVDGDGFADVIVGDQERGSAYLYLGSPSGLNLAPETTLAQGRRDDGFGYAVAGLGDVDGDGFGDVLVGAGFGRGCAYAFRGYGATEGTQSVTWGDCDGRPPTASDANASEPTGCAGGAGANAGACDAGRAAPHSVIGLLSVGLIVLRRRRAPSAEAERWVRASEGAAAVLPR